MTTQLPPQGPPEPDEKLLGEAELAALYRQLPQSEPSPALDAAVLRATAQALAPGEASPALRGAERERHDRAHPKSNTSAPSAGSGRRRPRWPIALSSAATLVLESEDRAKARGAQILGYLAGSGSAVAADPRSAPALRASVAHAAREALRTSALAPGALAWIALRR